MDPGFSLGRGPGRAYSGIGRRQKAVAILYVSSYIYGVGQLGPLFRRGSILMGGQSVSVRSSLLPYRYFH